MLRAIERIERVVMVWDAPVDLELHAFEFGARPQDAGHVGPDRPRSFAEVRRRDELPYVADSFLQSLRGLLATYLDRGPDRPWQLAERITCPTLLVYGKESWASNPETDGRIAHFQNARVVEYERAGHWVHHDRLDDFMTLVRDFLKD